VKYQGSVTKFSRRQFLGQHFSSRVATLRPQEVADLDWACHYIISCSSSTKSISCTIITI